MKRYLSLIPISFVLIHEKYELTKRRKLVGSINKNSTYWIT